MGSVPVPRARRNALKTLPTCFSTNAESESPLKRTGIVKIQQVRREKVMVQRVRSKMRKDIVVKDGNKGPLSKLSASLELQHCSEAAVVRFGLARCVAAMTLHNRQELAREA